MLGVVLGASRRIAFTSSSSLEWWLRQASSGARSWHTRRHSPTPAHHSQSEESLESALPQAFRTDPLLHGHGFHGPGAFGASGGSTSCAVPQSTQALSMRAQLSRCSASYVYTRLHVCTCKAHACTCHAPTCVYAHVHTCACAHGLLCACAAELRNPIPLVPSFCSAAACSCSLALGPMPSYTSMGMPANRHA